MNLQDRLAAVRTGPEGPGIGAFFDYDGTVIRGFSAKAFVRHRLVRLDIGVEELGQLLDAAINGVEDATSFDALMRATAKGLSGRTSSELDRLGAALYRSELAATVHDEAWQLIETHKAMGHTLAIASSATQFQVGPAARSLRVEHVLCTRLEEDAAGTLTGEIDGPILWGTGKADAVTELATKVDLDLGKSYAYSNGTEDLPFLEVVGQPCVLNGEESLIESATARGWPVLDCAPPPSANPVASLARTAGFYGAFGAAFGAGLGLSLVNKSRKQLLDLTGGVGSDLGLALAGIDVAVIGGAEHLWAHRPAVFIFNHQSNLDPIVVMHLLRHGYTGVAKAEAKRIPGFGQLFQLAGVAFVERGNAAQAREALAPAIAKVRDEGLSLAISPEGTRTLTPTVGEFKKGAFHIAMQAGVPVVPIVLNGVGRVMPAGAQLIRPGRVEVVVLPPIDTSGWTANGLAGPVAAVRQQYVALLADWPAASRAEKV